MAEQTDAHNFVQSRNKAMQFDREKRQKKIKDNLELHQDTQNTIKGMVDKLTNLNIFFLGFQLLIFLTSLQLAGGLGVCT